MEIQIDRAKEAVSSASEHAVRITLATLLSILERYMQNREPEELAEFGYTMLTTYALQDVLTAVENDDLDK